MKKFMLSMLLMGAANFLWSQHNIEGTVRDAKSGKYISEIVVVLHPGDLQISTDLNGNYRFSAVKDGDYVLQYLGLGYGEKRDSIRVSGQDLRNDVTLSFSLEDAYAMENMGGYVTIIQSADIEATAATAETPMAYSDIDMKLIEKINLAQDLPFLLEQSPSLVATSDAGAGVGYTSMRIRGSDMSRINVTVNGIPINDAESQTVFWVNMPDFTSSVNDIQIQRGVGTSANGAGSFGGSVKMNTMEAALKPYGQISLSSGSFGTAKQSVSFGTGLINGLWSVQGRLSQINSLGYIDRASSSLKSYYISGGYYGDKTQITAVSFGGKERTYQAWYGTPESRILNDSLGMMAHAERNNYTEAQTKNLLESGRTYNFYTYKDEVDDYNQDHYQLHLQQTLNDQMQFNLSGHYTFGKGYYEQYRSDDNFSDYGLLPISISSRYTYADGKDADGQWQSNAFNSYYLGWDQIELNHQVQFDNNGDTIQDGNGNALLLSSAGITKTDLVRRRWLQNDFYGTVFSLKWTKGRLENVIGGAWNIYRGDHYGEIIYMEHSHDLLPGEIYYFNRGEKTDFNIYGKTDITVHDKLHVFGDLQYRLVSYDVLGVDSDRRVLDVTDELQFVNPKAGLFYHVNKSNDVYFSVARGNREPQRTDYIDAEAGVRPKAESMTDFELGYKRKADKYQFGLNLYNMQYSNQLVLTGALNDVGTPVRTNVDKSYRRGLEFELTYTPSPRWKFMGNTTLSQNRIKYFEEKLYDYTTDFDVVTIVHEHTDIAFSPSVIAAASAEFLLFKKGNHEMQLAWMFKHVGMQYLDNSKQEDRRIEGYFVNNARFSYVFTGEKLKALAFNFMVNNILNEVYSSNGYTWGYISGERVTENFYYPQAGVNFMAGLSFSF